MKLKIYTSFFGWGDQKYKRGPSPRENHYSISPAILYQAVR